MFTGRVYAPVDLAMQSEPLASVARQAGVTSVANPAISDVSAQFIPWYAALRWSVAHGEFPLWNPFELGGSILAGAAQAAPYHPVTLLSLILPAPDGITFIAAMTYFLAALSAFLFFRTFCSSEIAALFGAIGWSLSQHLVSFILTAHGAAIAAFPLILFLVHKRRFLPLVAGMTLLALCGHPETLLHVALLTAVYTIVTKENLARLVAAGLVAALVSAVFLVPVISAIPQTREFIDRALHSAQNHNSWAVVLHLLRADVAPFTDGVSGIEAAQHSRELRHEWAGTVYAGAILFVPALFALRRSRTRMTWFFAGLLLFAVLIGADAPWISDAFGQLPLFSMAINSRMIAFGAFALCALAAIGFDRWMQNPEPMDAMFAAIAIVALVGLDVASPFARIATAREIVPLLLAFAVMRTTRSRTVAAAALVALLMLQRTVEIGGFVPTLDRRAFYPQFAGLELLQREQPPFRVVGTDVLLTPNAAAAYALEDVRGYEAMTFGRLAETFPLWSEPQAVWSNRVDDLTRPFLSLMNVRYAFVPPSMKLPDGWRIARSFENYRILENDRVLPRAFVPSVVHTGAQTNALRDMASCRDFGSEAWIETDGAPATQANGSGVVAIAKKGSGLQLHVAMQSPGWVVVSQTAWKGWRFLRGDQRLRSYVADHAFLAVYLPRGQHELVVDYWPRSFFTGGVITLVTLIGIVLFSIRVRISDLLGVPARPSPSSYPPTLPS